MRAYVLDCDRVFKRGTAVRIALAMDLFRRFLKGRGALTVADFSRQLMTDFNAWLARPENSRHGKKARSPETVIKNTSIVQRLWQWAYDRDDHGMVPPPKRLKMPSAPGRVTVAPTWAEMDACIAACATEWHRQLAILMRFTGLRVNQAMGLKWSDFDFERATLTVRGELGKTAQEMRGRVVPISPHLSALMQHWADDGGYVVKSKRMGKGRERTARARDMARAWARAGVRAAAWFQPNHAFRKGFVSGLKRAGADTDAVEVLVGHSLGLRGVYTDADAIPLRTAVALIPPLTPTKASAT